MASAYSILDSFNPVVAPLDLQLINTVLATKQGKFDRNVAEIDATLAELGNTANLLYREQDKEYLSNNVKGLLDTVNTSGKLDLSNNGVTRNIKNYVKSAIDDRVLNDISSSTNFRNYQAQVQEKIAKGDGSYSDVNYAYGLEQSGANEWMSGKKDSLGSIQYTDYTDISKEYKDFAENLDKYADVIKQTAPDGQGYFVTQEGKRLTEGEIKNKIYYLLSDKAKQQMQINGWASYDKGNTAEEKLMNVTMAFQNFRDNDLKGLQDRIIEVQAQSQNDPNNPQLRQTLENLSSVYKQKEDRYNEFIQKGRKADMYTTMYTENSLNGFAQNFAFDEVTTSYSTDQAYWNNANLNYKVQKDALDRADKKEKEVKVSSEGVALVDNLDSLKQDEVSSYEAQDTLVKGLESTLETEAETLYNNLKDETLKKAIDVNIAKHGNTLGRGNVIAIMLKSYNESSSNLVSTKDAQKLDKLQLQLNSEKATFNKYVKEVEKEVEAEALPKMFASTLNTDGIKLTTERGAVQYNQYLRNKGIDSFDKLKSNPEEYLKFKRQMYADAILSGNDDPYVVKMLADTFNEVSPMISDDINYVAGIVLPSTGGKVFDKSQTGRYLESVQSAGAYDKGTGFLGFLVDPANAFSGDNSITDTTRGSQGLRALNGESIKRRVGEKLEKDRTLTLNQTVQIAAESQAHKDLNLVLTGKMDVREKGVNLSINIIPNQPNMVRVTQTEVKTVTSKGGVSSVPTTQVAEIKIEDLPESVRAKVDFQNRKAVLTPENLPNVESKVSYKPSNKQRVYDLADSVSGLDLTLAQQTTIEGVKDLIFGTPQFTNVVGTINNPTEVGAIASRVITDPNITVKLNKTDYGIFPQVVRKVGNTEVVIWESDSRITEDNLDNVYEKIKYVPQLYVNSMLQKAITTAAIPNTPNHILDKLRQIYAN